LVVKRGVSQIGIKSVLLTEWELSNDFTLIEPCDIDGPCFVIMIKEDGSKILQILPCHLWASEFTEPVDKLTPVVDKKINPKLHINVRTILLWLLLHNKLAIAFQYIVPSICKVILARFCNFCPSYRKMYPRQNSMKVLLTKGVDVQ
jgi:hypothetical protein